MRLAPVKVLRHYVRREARLAYIRSRIEVGTPRTRILRCLRRLTDEEPARLQAYLDELEADGELFAHLDRAEAQFREEAPGLALGSLGGVPGSALYALTRALRPDTVLETGTANGVSTTFLLAALDRNRFGRLVSIDLPFTFHRETLVPLVAGSDIDTDYASPLPPGREPGWIVPARLRARWDLRLGDARTLLPEVLAEAPELRLFLHDSLHLREHMLFELETVWPYLASGGVLAADDVFQRRHNAWPSFVRSVGARYVTLAGAAFVRKP